MIVTEEEAKTKRCQESFGANNNVSDDGSSLYVPMPPAEAGVNKADFIHIPCAPKFCIGSQCMAWRWRQDNINGAFLTTHGYCGKAGEP
jgi:hypothetical protein